MQIEKSTEVVYSRDSRPTLRDLNRYIIPLVAAKWYDLGLELMDVGQEKSLEIIEQDNKHDVISCCRKMMAVWLQMSDTATWDQLVNAAQSVKLNDAVRAIENLCFPKG